MIDGNGERWFWKWGRDEDGPLGRGHWHLGWVAQHRRLEAQRVHAREIGLLEVL